MGFKKGQAALDFLMTYGWAIALVVIIAAVLFALGIFDVSNFVGNKAAGFSGVSVTGWTLTSDGTMTMKLSNQVGQKIEVQNVTVTVGGVDASLGGLPKTLNTGESTNTLTTGTIAQWAGTTGSGYTAKAVIKYRDLNADFNYTTSGTLTGRVA